MEASLDVHTCEGGVHKLSTTVKNYDWGKTGRTSIVAQLKEADDTDFRVDESVPYAELWAGSHPNGESIVYHRGGSWKLSSFLSKRGLPQLPYLLKVLSVGSSLSVQVHPDKPTAEVLHQNRPELYKDGNHKPEMAICLTRFQAMVGTRSIAEIRSLINRIPPLDFLIRKCIKDCDQELGEQCGFVKKLVQELLDTPPSLVKEVFDQVSALFQSDVGCVGEQLGPLFLKLHSRFPYDVGCFFIFIMNVVTLEAGEAIFISHNVPHAYLFGDCVECMANSDNVVRLGLTNKHKDSKVMLQITDFSHRPKSSVAVAPIVSLVPTAQGDDYVTVKEYKGEAEEFVVRCIRVSRPSSGFRLMQVPALSIMIVVESSCSFVFETEERHTSQVTAKRGSCHFFASRGQLTVETADEEFLAFVASPNGK